MSKASSGKSGCLGSFLLLFGIERSTADSKSLPQLSINRARDGEKFHMTYSFLRNLVCAFHASENGCRLLRGVRRLNCPAASTTVPAMKKSIILVSALSVVVMALVSCASDSDVDPFRVRTDTTTPYHEPAPAHDNIGGMNL
jgi:hypothetical protein